MDITRKFFQAVKPFVFLGSLFLSVYVFQEVYLCLLCGILLSYFLHTVVQYVYPCLKSLVPMHGCDSLLWNISIFISIALYILLGLLIGWIIIPSVIAHCKQVSLILTKEGTYQEIISAVQKFLEQPIISTLTEYIQPNLKVNQEIFLKAGSILKDWLNHLMGFISSIIYSSHNLINASIVLVTAFHIVREWHKWDRRLKKIRQVTFISEYADKIETFAGFCSTKMQSWIQGQLLITCIMVAYYSTCFLLLKLNTPLMLGFIFSISAFVPYVTDLISFLILVATLYVSNANMFTIVMSIVSVFLGHALSGYIIGPLLIGKTTKLNVIQVLIGFLLHMKLFGAVGVFLNIPFCIITNGLLKVLLTKPQLQEE